MVLAWALLLTAIGVEVASTAALPLTDGFRSVGWSTLVLGGYLVSIGLLNLVIQRLPVSVTYAIWAGLGTAGIAVVGTVFLGERMDVLKALAITLIVTGVVVLNLRGAH